MPRASKQRTRSRPIGKSRPVSCIRRRRSEASGASFTLRLVHETPRDRHCRSLGKSARTLKMISLEVAGGGVLSNENGSGGRFVFECNLRASEAVYFGDTTPRKICSEILLATKID